MSHSKENVKKHLDGHGRITNGELKQTEVDPNPNPWTACWLTQELSGLVAAS